jgi:alanyl-tRNA synthetase
MTMNAGRLKKLYIDFFKKKGHKEIPNVSLIPEGDPTVLFTTAGMHPLIPFLIGQPHPIGKRLVNVQKCIRTDDIEEIGDNRHLTFFEMLGNWSLGDYFKKDTIKWCWEFLTDKKKGLGLDPKRIYTSAFKGDTAAPADKESLNAWIEIFEEAGIEPKVDVPLVEGGRIFTYDRTKCWWGPVGETGPCGPNSEIFYDTGRPHDTAFGEVCHPNCDCGRFIEIWNDVFMEYTKTKDGKYEKLEQKNVDTGMGLERIVAILQNKETVFEIGSFAPIIERLKEIAKINNVDKIQKSVRIIADHARAATFILAEDIRPSNVERGYILRRLIRRAIRHGKLLGVEREFLTDLAKVVIDAYKSDYPQLEKNKKFILDELKKEDLKFRNTLSKGLRKFDSIAKKTKEIGGKDAFLLFQSFGFPIEMTKELAEERGISVDVEGFKEEFKRHQKLSRAGAKKRFKGGLSDASEETIRLHTATHLLNEALREVLKKKDIVQKGSNITPDRLRFDFNFDRKLTKEEIKEVEDVVNEWIGKALPVERIETDIEGAEKMGAQGVFKEKYGEKVSVYRIGDLSVEICGGPHVKNTKELGKFKIIKEESIAAGVRRIKAVLS